MNIRSSTALRTDYNGIARTARETQEPVFITKNGDGDTVLLSMETYLKREQTLNLRERLLVSERERLAGQVIDVEAADARLMEKFHAKD